MSSLTVYVINSDGTLDCRRSGDTESVLYAVDIEKKEYTLQPPPDNESHWRWVNNEWIATE